MNENNKRLLGQYFTVNPSWLKPHIVEFIRNSKCDIAYDPFAGNGDLLNSIYIYGIDEIKEFKGLDIDRNLQWEYNNSLVNIPHIDNAIIITNPPYLYKSMSSVLGMGESVNKYFKSSKWNDLYLIALDRMLEAQDYVVAIIPESFIHSNYTLKNKLVSITTLSDSPFIDTENACVVACFDNRTKGLDKIKVYRDNDYVFSLEYLLLLKHYLHNLITSRGQSIEFNNNKGWLGIRLLDKNTHHLIKFAFKDDEFDWENVKTDARQYTIVDINNVDDKERFIENCNHNINKLREITHDILLSPFRRTLKDGRRSRRLTFKLCRVILELAYNDLWIESEIQNDTNGELLRFTKGNKE